jgi:hypothetical protein
LVCQADHLSEFSLFNVGYRATTSQNAFSAISPILPANITGQPFSKMEVGNGGPAIPVAPRLRAFRVWFQLMRA